MDLAYVPKSWRTAKIVALKKPGKSDYTIPKAYRPISLLPTISKALEAIVATRLSYLAERYSLLPTNHFGGRKQRSCEQALDVLIEKILEAWRANQVLSLVTFDVQGAFKESTRKFWKSGCVRGRSQIAWSDGFAVSASSVQGAW